MVKIVAMSDTHNQHLLLDVPEGDILVHAGDMTNFGRKGRLEDFAQWFGSQPHKHKIAICGNHEVDYSENTIEVQDIFDEYGDIELLHDRQIEIEGLKFWGQPRSAEFFNWGWQYKRGQEAKALWEEMPEDTDVVISHGPPAYYGDLVNDMSDRRKTIHVGCGDFLNRLKKVKPKLSICGHIHESYGIYPTDFGTKVTNVALVDRHLRLIHKPMTLEVE